MRIVFLGDSLTWGGYGGNFVDEVQKHLPQHEIINAGVGGDTIINLLRRLDDVLDETMPDFLFVMVGGNDSTSYYMPQTRGYFRKAKQLENGMVTPDDFEMAYRELLEEVQLRFVYPLVGISPTEYSHEAILAKQVFNDRARLVAEQLAIPVLDLDAIFTPTHPIERPPVDLGFIQEIGVRAASGWQEYETERSKWGYTYTFDGMHLLPESALRFADYIVPFLNKHV